MTSIRVVYSAEPNFPAADQHPDAARYFVGGKWVDAVGGEPTEADLAAYLYPPETPLMAIKRLENANPMTHRGHGREFPLFIETVIRQIHAKINALDAEIAVLANRTAAPLPNIPVTHMIALIKTVDDAIKVERAKL